MHIKTSDWVVCKLFPLLFMHTYRLLRQVVKRKHKALLAAYEQRGARHCNASWLAAEVFLDVDPRWTTDHGLLGVTVSVDGCCSVFALSSLLLQAKLSGLSV